MRVKNMFRPDKNAVLILQLLLVHDVGSLKTSHPKNLR